MGFMVIFMGYLPGFSFQTPSANIYAIFKKDFLDLMSLNFKLCQNLGIFMDIIKSRLFYWYH